MSAQEDPKKASDSTNDALAEMGRAAASPTKFALERERTDESLRQEREKTDQAVESRQDNMAKQAEAVVERARDAADAVLSVARDKADAVLDTARDRADERHAPGTPDSDKAVLGAERRVADRALQTERDSADEVLSEERGEYAYTFLPLERESTNRYLRSERIRSDDAVANRDDFLAMVTHDMRDLLGGIVLSSAVLAKRAGQDEAGETTLAETRRIARYAARMGRLIGDLVDIASIDAGKLAVSPTAGNLAALVAEAADAFEAAAAFKGIALESRIVAAPLPASFDHDRMLQVLGNLISNSLKHTPEGGTITLVGERDGGDVRLTVDDTGSGIPAEALASVFERFYQVGGSERGGLGLGLYISRCLVHAHGGSIQAESKAGTGTRMCVRLPA